MQWNNLHADEREFYHWFHRKSCGHWNTSRADGMLECPVLRAQLHVQPTQNQAIYYPEPLSGDPRSRLWVMGINPGGGELDDLFRDGLPNALDPAWRHLGVEGYADHHLQYYHHHAHDRFWSLGHDVAGKLEIDPVTAGEDPFAVSNVVHCKCVSWVDPEPCFGTQEVEELLYPTCGRQTFDMLRHWRPRYVFCIRADIFAHWLPWCTQHEVGFVCERFDGGLRLTWPNGTFTDLLRCWQSGHWPHEATVDAAVAAALAHP